MAADLSPAARAGAVLALVGLAACAAPEAPDPAVASALALFRMAHEGEPDDDRIASLFDPTPADERDRAALLDALASLTELPEPRVVAVERPSGPGDVFVDLEATLPGDGLASFTVRVREQSPGTWRVRWFQGVGEEWPRRDGARDEGLTSSAPPGPPR